MPVGLKTAEKKNKAATFAAVLSPNLTATVFIPPIVSPSMSIIPFVISRPIFAKTAVKKIAKDNSGISHPPKATPPKRKGTPTETLTTKLPKTPVLLRKLAYIAESTEKTTAIIAHSTLIIKELKTPKK